jgi:pyridoxamine 5'-phosphate oxidase
MNLSIADLRKNNSSATLNENEVAHDPIAQIEQWFDKALQSQLPEPNAMTLSTVSAEGRPSARIVLLKGITKNGFLFYTNYDSRKGKELAAHPFAALTFFWIALERQVRIEGTVTKVDVQTSATYFHSRPLASQIGAWASPQSTVIADRSLLEQQAQAYTEKFANQEVPLPPHWGGYQVTPDRIEFWQGRPSRLHDRILYTRTKGDQWETNRLAP